MDPTDSTPLTRAPIPSELIESARDQALENVFDAVVVTDLDGRVVYWNRGSEQLYGYAREEVLGQSVDLLHVPEEREHVLAEVLDHIERFGSWQGEIGMLHKDGRQGWIESSVVPLFDTDGEPIGALGINRDISARVEAERARTRLFADISHELRTPLTLTLGPLDDVLAELHGPLSPDLREPVAQARRNAARVLELTRQVLELARIEAGSAEIKVGRFELEPFVQQMASLFGPLAERRGIRLNVSAAVAPLSIHADPERIETILSTLLSNAFDSTPDGGAVRVSLEADDQTAILAVRDSGPGIPAGELERVFDRFQRKRRPGTPTGGVRMALARELAELHGGTLTVQSDEGFGSTFTVTLPRGTAHLEAGQRVEGDVRWSPRATGPAPEPLAPTGSPVAAVPGDTAVPGPPIGEDADQEDVPTVLVVEDDPDIRAYLRTHLEGSYRVLEAADGDRGWDLVQRALPDLVLADVMMPGRDGYALCRAIKSSAATDFIPVVLLTARAAPEDRLTGLEHEADDYLTKPFRVKELLARLANLIESRKKLRERFSVPALVLGAEPIEVESADGRFLEQVRVAIEENLGDEDYNVERLASDVAHSRGHLHRRLRELIDETPSDLLRRMRLERAGQLIEAGAGSIGTIAYAVGFKSISHFSNRFQDHFGVRPSAYSGPAE